MTIAPSASTPPARVPNPGDAGGQPAVTSAQVGGLRLSHTVASWLERRGYVNAEATQEFLKPLLSRLTPPGGMVDRDRAAVRLAQAIRSREQVVVFGDYDCDGVTSAAIMTEVLRSLGAHVVPLLASRFDGGYGVSLAASDKILQAEPQLLVTCDCGSSDHERLSRISSAGVDVIVIDHHLVPDEPLPAVAFLNPHRPECNFPYKGMASCGLALSIAAALRKELGVKLDIRRWLDLVALGTIADVAPLDGDNRALVRAGLEAIRRAERPGLRALLELAKVSRETPITGRDVSFRLAPHLNAPGRMGSPELALQLLLAETDEAAAGLAAEVEQVTQTRRAVQAEMLAAAREEIEAHGYGQQPAIVIGREGWNHGIVGIVAGRLTDEYQVPVVVIGFNNGVGHGSVRGPKGVQLHTALGEVAHLLERFGGHQAAAGLELRVERLSELRVEFCKAIERQSHACNASELTGRASQVQPSKENTESEDLTLPLDTRDTPERVLRDLDSVEPCGEGNPRPKLEVKGQVLEAREVSGGHLKLVVDLGQQRRLGCFGVNMGEQASKLTGPVTLVGDLRYNTFNGVTRVEMFAEELVCADVGDS